MEKITRTILPQRFIVVDDDRSNNLICQCSLRRFSAGTEIKTFLDPEVALQYIKDSYDDLSEIPSVIFLDINMPAITGWEFLEIFNEFSVSIKEQFVIYMLTSSIDARDKERAELNPLVQGFLSKPLSTQLISKVLGDNENLWEF